jgi:AraC-like DNA-binding protein
MDRASLGPPAGWGPSRPQIGRAIALVHATGRAWTLALLSSAVGMSRSAFAARFTQLVGEPAMPHGARPRCTPRVVAQGG